MIKYDYLGEDSQDSKPGKGNLLVDTSMSLLASKIEQKKKELTSSHHSSSKGGSINDSSKLKLTSTNQLSISSIGQLSKKDTTNLLEEIEKSKKS
jgi:hypothetical protein